MPETETVTISSDSERYAKQVENEYVRMKKKQQSRKLQKSFGVVHIDDLSNYE